MSTEYQHQSELVNAIYQATKDSHNMQRDDWVESLYLLHPSGWSIYCTPFLEGEKCTTIVAVSEDGQNSEVVSVWMGHQPHSRTVDENLARYISILPLIETIGDALVRRASRLQSVWVVLGKDGRKVGQYQSRHEAQLIASQVFGWSVEEHAPCDDCGAPVSPTAFCGEGTQYLCPDCYGVTP